MAKGTTVTSNQYAAGIAASSIRPEWAKVVADNSTALVWPYGANLQWQNTSSNSTYCNAATALAIGAPTVS